MKGKLEEKAASWINGWNPHNLAFRMMPVFAGNLMEFLFHSMEVHEAVRRKMEEKEEVELDYIRDAGDMNKIVTIIKEKINGRSLSMSDVFNIITSSVHESIKGADRTLAQKTGRDRKRAFYIHFEVEANAKKKLACIKMKRNTLVMHGNICETYPLQKEVFLKLHE